MALRGAVSGSAGGGGAGLTGSLLANFQAQYASALATNQARYQQTLAGFQAREQAVQDLYKGAEERALKSNDQAYAQDVAKGVQNLARRGLSNTTIASQYENDSQERRNSAEQDITGRYADARTAAYLNASGQTLGFQGSYKDPYPSDSAMAGLATSADSLAERQRQFDISQEDRYRSGGGGGGGGSGGGGPGGGYGAGGNFWGQQGLFQGTPNNSYGYYPDPTTRGGWPGGFGVTGSASNDPYNNPQPGPNSGPEYVPGTGPQMEDDYGWTGAEGGYGY